MQSHMQITSIVFSTFIFLSPCSVNASPFDNTRNEANLNDEAIAYGKQNIIPKYMKKCDGYWMWSFGMTGWSPSVRKSADLKLNIKARMEKSFDPTSAVAKANHEEWRGSFDISTSAIAAYYDGKWHRFFAMYKDHPVFSKNIVKKNGKWELRDDDPEDVSQGYAVWNNQFPCQ